MVGKTTAKTLEERKSLYVGKGTNHYGNGLQRHKHNPKPELKTVAERERAYPEGVPINPYGPQRNLYGDPPPGRSALDQKRVQMDCDFGTCKHPELCKTSCWASEEVA